jgi:GMP synthase (glutamine-hydrolysing)
MPAAMRPRPILTIVCGQPPEDLGVPGDYVDWLQVCAGERVHLRRHPAPEPAQKLNDFAGILITGSPASLTAPEPWMELVVETIRDASTAGVPVLGVCFGHQLVAVAYGAPVLAAPDGKEHGSCVLSLTERGKRDPLFKDLPETFLVQQSHDDSVEPESVGFGLELLATSPATRVQAVAAGSSVRAVQFHPEFTVDITNAYQRRARLPEAARDCPFGTRVMQNWVEEFALRS